MTTKAAKKPNPKKTKKLTPGTKAKYLAEKIGELRKARAVLLTSQIEWQEAHAHAGELKKTLEKNQARLNGICTEIDQIESGNYTPSLPFTDEPAAVSQDGQAHDPAVDAGAAMPLMELSRHGLTKKKCDAIAEQVGGDTIGHLEKAMRENEWWHRDLKGFGEEWLTKLQDAHLAFRQAHPMPEAGKPESVSVVFGGKTRVEFNGMENAIGAIVSDAKRKLRAGEYGEAGKTILDHKDS